MPSIDHLQIQQYFNKLEHFRLIFLLIKQQSFRKTLIDINLFPIVTFHEIFILHLINPYYT